MGVSGGASASFVYDGDGQRVKATVNGMTTVSIGDYYEQAGSTVRKYYYAGGQRVALRENGTLYYLLTDHLTSTAITANASGARVTELRYFAYGGTRDDAGGQLTSYRYTGQRIETGTGLYNYGARWYDPAIGRFLAPDTIAPEPGNPQAARPFTAGQRKGRPCGPGAGPGGAFMASLTPPRPLAPRVAGAGAALRPNRDTSPRAGVHATQYVQTGRVRHAQEKGRPRSHPVSGATLRRHPPRRRGPTRRDPSRPAR